MSSARASASAVMTPTPAHALPLDDEGQWVDPETLPFARAFSPSQLRAFSSAAALGSISRGAAALARSQPAVTQAIANLERSFGTPLFLRRRSGLALTDAGVIVRGRLDRYFGEIRTAVVAAAFDKGWVATEVEAIANRLTKPLITALLLIDEVGSASRAARLLGQREATLRKAAASLEAATEMALFTRDSHGINTNPRGTLLATHLRLAMRELEAAREEVDAGGGVENGRILAGAMMLAGNQLMTTSLQRFTRSHPLASVSVMNASYDVLLDRLKRGAIDFLVGLQNHPSPDDTIVETVIAADPFILAVRRGHPLTARGSLTRADLAGYDWVLSAPGAVRRAAFDRLFGSVGKPAGRVETHSIVTILSLLASSDAIAILTRSELLLDRQLGHHLAALDFGPLDTESSVAMTTRRGWLPTRLQSAFAACVMASGTDGDDRRGTS